MEVQELDVSLTVAWNNNRRLDDIYGFKGRMITHAMSECQKGVVLNIRFDRDVPP